MILKLMTLYDITPCFAAYLCVWGILSFWSYLNRDPAKFFPTSSPLLLMISIPDPNTFWEGTRHPPNHSPKILQKGTAGSGNDIPKLMLAKPYVWLVVSTPLKNMKVSWDDDIPNIWKVIKVMFQTTNQITIKFPLLLVYSLWKPL